MLYNLIITAILIASFLMSITSYFMGFKHGKEFAKGNIPTIKLNPVKPLLEAIENIKTKVKADSKVDKVEADLIDIMSYTKESALEFMKKEANK